MKRRTFLHLSTLGAASLFIPAPGCNTRYTLTNKALAQPTVLTHICDSKALRQIGKAYKQQVPAEQDDRKLVGLILTDANGQAVPETTAQAQLEAVLNQKISREFEQGQTVVVDGWVLSPTEARQCALYASQA